MATHYFTEVDDIIIAAYNHVKQTGYKVQDYSLWQDGEQIELGLEAKDGTIFAMTKIDHANPLNKINYARLIHRSGIGIVDFVNLQLKAFL